MEIPELKIPGPSIGGIVIATILCDGGFLVERPAIVLGVTATNASSQKIVATVFIRDGDFRLYSHLRQYTLEKIAPTPTGPTENSWRY